MRTPMTGRDDYLLDIRNLLVRFRGAETPAINGLDLQMRAGETLALVGESGCGKSTTALSIMGILPASAEVSGEVRLEGENTLGVTPKRLRQLRGAAMSMIFQEPMTALNPVHRIGDQIVEILRCHLPLSRRQARARALELIELVRLPDPKRIIDEYPHRLSGGQRQRVMIAMAIACRPRLLIADEPTTALDATIQAQILELLDELRRKLGMGLLLITHDLTLVSRWTDRVVVMHHGEKLETLPTAELYRPGRHPYTSGLIKASIRLDEDVHYTRSTLAEIKVSREEDGAYRYAVSEPRPQFRPVKAVKPTLPLLAVNGLSVDYETHAGRRRALDNASLTLSPGETLGIVGESGSGKSTLSKAIMRLVPAATGSIMFDGQDISRLNGDRLRPVRRKVQMVFQDPYGSLNPRESVRDILEGALIVHGVIDPAERQRQIASTLDHVGLPLNAIHRFPHEFSGGQRQRIGIARALVLQPSLVICDEPVSALDVSIQAQVLNLLVELKASLGLSYLFISHDLGVVRYISDRVIVMKDARIVEESDHATIWRNPATDYTRRLIAAASGGRPEDAAAPASLLQPTE